MSTDYKQAMKRAFRPSSSFRISLGVFNLEAPELATLQQGEGVGLPHSKLNDILGTEIVSTQYATFETKGFPLNGSTSLLGHDFYHRQGYIYSKLSDVTGTMNQDVLTISFKRPCDFVGYTLVFDPNVFPKSLVLKETLSNGEVKARYYTNNHSQIVMRTDAKNVVKIQLHIREMNYPYVRFRLQHFQFGLGKLFENEALIDVTHEHYVHPVSAELPTGDLTFKVKNEQGEFAVDNPQSLLQYLSDDQIVNVTYGLNLETGTEWVNLGRFYLREWSTDNKGHATFKATDCYGVISEHDTSEVLETIGVESPSFGDIARSLFEKAGLSSTDYVVDPYLNRLTTLLSLDPEWNVLESLQYVAVASRCILTKTDDGKPWIRPNFEPKYELSSESLHSHLSNLNSLILTDAVDHYATFEPQAFPLHGQVHLVGKEASLNSGVASEKMNGESTVKVSISYEAPVDLYNLTLNVSNVKTLKVIHRNSSNQESQKTYAINGESLYLIPGGFVDTSSITFITSPMSSGVRTYLHRINGLGRSSDFYITSDDTFDKPKATLLSQVASVSVPYREYNSNLSEWLEFNHRYNINANGQHIKSDVQLLDNSLYAENVAKWLGDYLNRRREWTIEYRGNPEVVAGDIIYLRSAYVGDMRCVVLSNRTTFKSGALRGTLIVRSEYTDAELQNRLVKS